MATASAVLTAGTTMPVRNLGQRLAIYRKEIRYEFLTRLRLRAYSASVTRIS